jgi:rhodanese-related sulfurtransferase
VLLFAGGYAAGQGSRGAANAGLHTLERQAEPIPGDIGLVTPEQVLAVDAESYLLVDVRGHDAYEFAHAVGALSMPDSEMTEMASTLPTDRTLVLYCTCPDDKTSIRAARTLAGVFHVTNVVALKGGLIAFRHAGGAVSSNATDSAIEHQGCGCSSNAEAFKLMIQNKIDQQEQAESGE